MRPPPEPPQGLCQPPAMRSSADGGVALCDLGLADHEIFDLAVWLKVHHPRTFELGLLDISEFRQRRIARERAS